MSHSIISILFPVLFFTNCALTVSSFTPCRTSDNACIEKSLNAAFPDFIVEHKEWGTENLDPLFVDYIEGNLSILKYKFFNTTILGFSKCKISDPKLSADFSTFHLILNCPTLDLTGKYDINGRLIILPVEGNGDYQLISGQYRITVDTELKTFKGSDGKSYVGIKNFKLKNEALTPIKFDFKNLFNGQKDLSDAVHKFAHESWKEVAELVQDPTWYAAMKKIISNLNKYLKHVPLENIIINN